MKDKHSTKEIDISLKGINLKLEPKYHNVGKFDWKLKSKIKQKITNVSLIYILQLVNHNHSNILNLKTMDQKCMWRKLTMSDNHWKIKRLARGRDVRGGPKIILHWQIFLLFL